MLMYTSLRPDMFRTIDDLMHRFQIKYIDGWTPSFIPLSDQLLMTFMKLTMNTPFLDLAERFNTSAASVNNIVTSQMCALHEVLYERMIENNIPSLQKCKGSMPTSFGTSVPVVLFLMLLKLLKMYQEMTCDCKQVHTVGRKIHTQ